MSLFSMLKPNRTEDREAAQAAFWRWFQANTAYLESYLDDTAAVVAEVGKRLDAVSRNLTFELGRADDGVYDFIVSADGIRDVFPEVVALVKAAPSIPGWRIIAFRPRKPGSLGKSVRFEGMELGTNALWYRSDAHEDRIDLTLCVAGQGAEGAHAFLGPVFLLLDATLGEYDVGTKIGAIEFADCPGEPAAAGFAPIADLAGEVDARFAASPV